MTHEELPQTAFVDPHGANREDVERLAREVLALVLGSLATAASREIDRFAGIAPPP